MFQRPLFVVHYRSPLKGIPVGCLGNPILMRMGAPPTVALPHMGSRASEGQCVTALGYENRSLCMAVGVGDIVRITTKLLLFGVDDLVNVFHFVVAVNATADDTAFMVEVALEMDTLYLAMNAIISDNCSYVSVEGQNITKDELLPSTPWPTLVTGGDVDSMLPEMNSICVFHRTLKPRVRAAKFLPPTAENQNLEGAVSVAAIALAQAFGDALTATLVGVNIAIDYVAFNRVLGTTTPVTQAIVPTRFRTQRRRRVGVGS